MLHALAHINLSLGFFFIIILVTDRFNRAMAFINNDITKTMMLVFSILVILESVAFAVYMTFSGKNKARLTKSDKENESTSDEKEV